MKLKHLYLHNQSIPRGSITVTIGNIDLEFELSKELSLKIVEFVHQNTGDQVAEEIKKGMQVDDSKNAFILKDDIKFIG